ncbi:unnamed protein product [Cunninghamella blakesleeana]
MDLSSQPMSSSPQRHFPYMQPSPTPTAISQHVMNEKEEYHPEVKNQYNTLSSSDIDIEKGIKKNPNYDDDNMNINGNEDINSLQSQKKKKKKDLKDRHCCVRCCCCSCLPKWARVMVWIIIIAIIIVIIIIGSIFATFKMPVFDMVGLDNSTNHQNSPSGSFSLSDGSINFKFALSIYIENPNIFPLHFGEMETTAYYPISEDSGIKTNVTKIRIGAGYLDSIWIPKQSNLTFSYPFEIQYNPSLDIDQYVLTSLMDKCGLSGETPQDLSIQYDIKLAASALFVTLHPTISSSAQFKCPIADGTLGDVAFSTSE